MKYPALALASLALVLCAPSHGPQALGQPASTRAVAFDGTDDFLKAMRKAMTIGANDEIVKLVRRQEQAAIWSAIKLCEANSNNPSERLENEINALRLAWKAAKKSNFVDKIYEYYSLVDSNTRIERAKLVNHYLAYLPQLLKAEAANDQAKILKLAADFRGVAEGLETTGDAYYTAQAWLCYSRTQDEVNRGTEANLDEAAMALKKVVDYRIRIDLKDNVYADSFARYETLKRLGYGPEAEAKGAGTGAGKQGPGDKPAKAKGPAQPVGDPLLVSLGFRVEPEIMAIQRPIWSNDEVYNAWNTIYFEKEGATTTLPALDGAVLERTGPTSFALVSGENRSEANMNGKFMPVEVKLKGDSGDYPWAFLAIIGTRQDTYQGVTINMEPAEEGISIYVAPAAVLTGELNETPIEVYDDTMSGKWGDEPRSWAYVGMSPGHYQLDLDSIRIDGGKKALPWSRLQKVGGAWFDLKIEGTQLHAQPVEVKTGTMKLKFKGPKPRFMIVRGVDNLSESFFDLTASKKIEVPVGKYELFCGMLAKGKRDGVKKMIVLPGEQTPVYEVELDKETLVTLGGPFAFDFKFEDKNDMIKVLGASVVVVGQAGERYERPWNARAHPEVAVRRAGAKRGSKAKKMQSNLDQDLLYADWGLGFHPQDLELPKPKGADTVEVQMTEKKHALLGGLSSPWKGESAKHQ